MNGVCGCGCGQATKVARYTHRRRGWVRGQPLPYLQGHKSRAPLEVRFWQKVDRRGPEECWLWTGARWRGYGQFQIEGQTARATRVGWELYHGTSPGALHVLHRCDNPGCINPAHLFLGTHAENMQDRASKGRQARLLGSRHGRAKLTEGAAREIRKRFQAGERQADLAREFRVSDASVSAIVRGITWRHV